MSDDDLVDRLASGADPDLDDPLAVRLAALRDVARAGGDVTEDVLRRLEHEPAVGKEGG